MDLIEWVGVITGILAVYLLYLNHILTWPVGFVNIGCFIWMFWNQKLYGDFAVQLIFLIMGIWGWIRWNNKNLKLPGRLSNRGRVVLVLSTVIFTPLVSYYLKNFTDCSYPMSEATILSLSIFGQYLTALRKIENWVYWIIADFLMIIVYSLKGLYPTAIYATIILLMGITGWLRWKKLLREGQ